MNKVTNGILIAALAGILSFSLQHGALAFGSSSNSSTNSGSSDTAAPAGTTTKPASTNPYDAALAKINAGSYAEAIPLLQQSLAENAQNSDALNELGFSLRKVGRLPESLAAYKKALALNPGHINANEYLGELYLQMKQPDMAKKQLSILDKLCPSGCEQRSDLQEQISAYKG
ncbi:MAG TPA: tetratricopeptide repeat protein [Dongiaceae bacterium]